MLRLFSWKFLVIYWTVSKSQITNFLVRFFLLEVTDMDMLLMIGSFLILDPGIYHLSGLHYYNWCSCSCCDFFCCNIWYYLFNLWMYYQKFCFFNNHCNWLGSHVFHDLENALENSYKHFSDCCQSYNWVWGFYLTIFLLYT